MSNAIEYRTMDKSGWGHGEWQDEPDKTQWTDEATGLPCLIVRNHGGALCGYVGLPPQHPWFEKDYDDLPVEVHGGLTYADHCQQFKPAYGTLEEFHAKAICHIPSAGQPDNVWWLGFDTAHSYDLSPAYAARLGGRFSEHEIYRNLAYVKAQVAKLAQQVKEVA